MFAIIYQQELLEETLFLNHEKIIQNPLIGTKEKQNLQFIDTQQPAFLFAVFFIIKFNVLKNPFSTIKIQLTSHKEKDQKETSLLLNYAYRWVYIYLSARQKRGSKKRIPH